MPQVSSWDASYGCCMRLVERIEQQVRFDIGELRHHHKVEVLLCGNCRLICVDRRGVGSLAVLQVWIDSDLTSNAVCWVPLCL